MTSRKQQTCNEKIISTRNLSSSKDCNREKYIAHFCQGAFQLAEEALPYHYSCVASPSLHLLLMSSNIPSAPANGVYASQLIRFARCCSNYSDLLSRHRALVTRLLSQGYKVNRLSNTFKKFYDRHMDLVGQYKKNVCQMFADSIS